MTTASQASQQRPSAFGTPVQPSRPTPTFRCGTEDTPQTETPRGESKSAPRLALSVAEACESLGVSQRFWRDNIAEFVPVVRLGRRKLIPVAALEAFLAEHAEALTPPTVRTHR